MLLVLSELTAYSSLRTPIRISCLMIDINAVITKTILLSSVNVFKLFLAIHAVYYEVNVHCLEIFFN